MKRKEGGKEGKGREERESNGEKGEGASNMI